MNIRRSTDAIPETPGWRPELRAELPAADPAAGPALRALYREIWDDLDRRLARPIRVSRRKQFRIVTVLDALRIRFDPEAREVALELLSADASTRGGKPRLSWSHCFRLYNLGAPRFPTFGLAEGHLERWKHRLQPLARVCPLTGAPDVPRLAKAMAKRLARDFERAADLRALQRRLREALALDPEVLDLARRSCRKVRGSATDRYLRGGVVTQERYARVWQKLEVYREVAREAPNLLWLLDFAICRGLEPPAGRVLATLKEALLADGLQERSWRLLARSARRDFDPVLCMVRGRPRENLVAWLRLHEKLDLNEVMPRAFQRALLRQFVAPHADEVERLEWIEEYLDLRFLKLAAREAIARKRAGTLDAFVRDEFGVALRWAFDGDRKALLANGNFGWRALLRHARRWREAEARRRSAHRCQWSFALGARRYGEYEVRPLSNSYELWLEGIEMHHCAGDYVLMCLGEIYRCFSIRSAADGKRLATLLIEKRILDEEGDLSVWTFKSVKGFANAPVCAALERLGHQVAHDYNLAAAAAEVFSAAASASAGAPVEARP